MKIKSKMLRRLLLLLFVVIIVTGGYFGQKYYYEQKAIENTRFITFLSNKEFPSTGASFVTILDTVFENPIWTQSHISEDKYVVQCKGTFDNYETTAQFYFHDNGKDKNPTMKDKSMILYKGKKHVEGDYGYGVLITYYFEKKGMTMPQQLKEAHEQLIQVAKYFPLDPKDIDADDLDKAQKSINQMEKRNEQENSAQTESNTNNRTESNNTNQNQSNNSDNSNMVESEQGYVNKSDAN